MPHHATSYYSHGGGHTRVQTHTNLFPDKSHLKKPGAHQPGWFKKSTEQRWVLITTIIVISNY